MKLAFMAGVAFLVAAALYLLSGGFSSKSETLALGQEVYAADCAACHGADLEGQATWQTPGENGRLPAPPHDASGHTWHHSDELLFLIVKEGTAAVVGNGYESDMPAFGATLSDRDIHAVLEFIKSRWPEDERLYQEDM
ncbi:c-type cytochrome [Georhizobium profundi]|nr:cytochrome c [Georhizobium profundi]